VRTDRRAEIANPIVAFRSFEKAPNNGLNMSIEPTAAGSSYHASSVPTPK